MASSFALTLAGVIGDSAFARAMERYTREFARYRNRLPTIACAYSRTRLALASDYEIVVMNWAPHSVSPIHDHGNSRCWVVMLEGRLDVQNYACDARERQRDSVAIVATEHLELRSGDIDHRLAPTELHRVANLSPTEAAFSLQLYAPPLRTYSIVDLHARRRRTATSTFDLDLAR